jgi:hypothetical protein
VNNFDITRRRAHETAAIPLDDGEGSPLLDDNGKPLSTTVHGPGSKTWRDADAERNRKRALKLEKNRNKISAVLADARDDDIDFLVAITVSFNGWEYPHPNAANGGAWPTQRDMFRAAYSDDSIGYVRDKLLSESGDWAAFTKASSAA